LKLTAWRSEKSIHLDIRRPALGCSLKGRYKCHLLRAFLALKKGEYMFGKFTILCTSEYREYLLSKCINQAHRGDL
jgi:hypothetical protein